MIDSFQDENRWLSNFYLSNILVNNLIYPSVENAYQALKERNKDNYLKYTICSPYEAKQLGKKAELIDNWNDVKLRVMLFLVREKFKDFILRVKLLGTQDKILIEGNNWGDTFWGMCNGKGENNLGKILMQVRSEINNG